MVSKLKGSLVSHSDKRHFLCTTCGRLRYLLPVNDAYGCQYCGASMLQLPTARASDAKRLTSTERVAWTKDGFPPVVKGDHGKSRYASAQRVFWITLSCLVVFPARAFIWCMLLVVEFFSNYLYCPTCGKASTYRKSGLWHSKPNLLTWAEETYFERRCAACDYHTWEYEGYIDNRKLDPEKRVGKVSGLPPPPGMFDVW